MGARKGSPAKARIGAERPALHDFTDGTEAPVLELTNVKITARLRVRRPAKKNVACRLQGALALDDTNALMGYLRRRRGQLFKDGIQRLLDLQKQMLAIRSHEQADGAKCADAANADHF